MRPRSTKIGQQLKLVSFPSQPKCARSLTSSKERERERGGERVDWKPVYALQTRTSVISTGSSVNFSSLILAVTVELEVQFEFGGVLLVAFALGQARQANR